MARHGAEDRRRSGEWSSPDSDDSTSGRPVLSERRDLKLVSRRARVLVGQEENGVGDPARVGQGLRRDTRACGTVKRLDARVDDQQGHLDAAGAQLECGSVGDRSHAERSAAHKPRLGRARRAEPPVTWIRVAGRPCAIANRPLAERNENAERAGAAVHESKPSRSASATGPPPNGPERAPPYAEAAFTIRSTPP